MQVPAVQISGNTCPRERHKGSELIHFVEVTRHGCNAVGGLLCGPKSEAKRAHPTEGRAKQRAMPNGFFYAWLGCPTCYGESGPGSKCQPGARLHHWPEYPLSGCFPASAASQGLVPSRQRRNPKRKWRRCARASPAAARSEMKPGSAARQPNWG
jgi:hypothetical protein